VGRHRRSIAAGPESGITLPTLKWFTQTRGPRCPSMQRTARWPTRSTGWASAARYPSVRVRAVWSARRPNNAAAAQRSRSKLHRHHIESGRRYGGEYRRNSPPVRRTRRNSRRTPDVSAGMRAEQWPLKHCGERDWSFATQPSPDVKGPHGARAYRPTPFRESQPSIGA
jgi:hypothetical protein